MFRIIAIGAMYSSSRLRTLYVNPISLYPLFLFIEMWKSDFLSVLNKDSLCNRDIFIMYPYIGLVTLRALQSENWVLTVHSINLIMF